MWIRRWGLDVARRRGNEFGEHAKAGFCWDRAIRVGGSVDRPFVSDDVGLNIDVPITYDGALEEQDALDILRGFGRVATKAGNRDEVPLD